MTVSSPSEFARNHGILGYLHFLIFPVDMFVSGDEYFEAAREQRVGELTPIFFWLIPLLLILSNFTYLQGLGLAAFFLLEIIILIILSIIYCWRFSLSFIIELFINLFLSFLILGLFVTIMAFLWASCGIIAIIVIAIGLFSYLGKAGGFGHSDDRYYDDDW